MEEEYQSPPNTERVSYQEDPVKDPRALELMLLSREILDKVKIFLEGKVSNLYMDENQELKQETISIGERKANDKGIQWLMFWLESKFNSQAVLGNMDSKQYKSFLRRVRTALVSNLMKNLNDYEMTTKNFSEVTSVLMEQLEVYMTRTINAGAVRSITPTIRHTETIGSQDNKRKGFGWRI